MPCYGSEHCGIRRMASDQFRPMMAFLNRLSASPVEMNCRSCTVVDGSTTHIDLTLPLPFLAGFRRARPTQAPGAYVHGAAQPTPMQSMPGEILVRPPAHIPLRRTTEEAPEPLRLPSAMRTEMEHKPTFRNRVAWQAA
jgi:hypothetical protein